MRVLLLLALLLFPATVAAQDIGPVRPTAGASPTEVLNTDPNAGAGWFHCLLIDGMDFLDPANHFDCQAHDAVDNITDHTVIVVAGGGNVVVRAVTVNAAGIISEPSVNKKTVQDVPIGPTFVSDSAEVAGTEDIS